MKILFAWVCLIGMWPAWAYPPPELVYRMDTRSPDDIFRNGFIPVGHNTNLYEHVEGFTCFGGDRTSGFVATTDDESFATGWGSWWLSNGSHFFVYRIRPTTQFYSTTASLMHAYQSEGREAYRMLADRFIGQGEWVSRGRIPALSIVDATEYISRGSGGLPPTRVTIHTNTGYVEAPAEVNVQPYRWNTEGDGSSSSSGQQALCEATCLNPLFDVVLNFRRKRQADTIDDATLHVDSCRKAVFGRVSALIASFADPSLDEHADIKGVDTIQRREP